MVKLSVVTQSTPAQADIDGFNSQISPRIVDLAMFMMTIETDPVLWSNYQAYALATHSTPIVTHSSGVHKLSDFTSGTFDSTGLHSAGLQGFADSAKTVPVEIKLRLFHEFNGSFNTSYGYTKETAAQYVAGWKHVHDIFTARGVTNVKWVWNPNIWDPAQPSIGIDPTVDDGSGSSWYPGDAYVDYIALDGYMTVNTNQVTLPRDLFISNMRTLRSAIPNKPFAIGETGCAAQSRLSSIGGKAGWFASLASFITNDVPDLAWLTYWNRHDSTNDYTIDSQGSDPAALAAFKALVNAAPFVGNTGGGFSKKLILGGGLSIG